MNRPILLVLLAASQLALVPLNAFGNSFALINVTAPDLVSVSDSRVCNVSVGQGLVIATVLRILSDEDVKFMAIVEARDSDGVTESLSLQTGTLEIGGQTQVGVSWTPAKAGQYQLRAFVISGFDDAQVLSVVANSDVDIAAKGSPGAC